MPVDWPEDRDFRILSIDGGGIRGIFPAAFLAGLEERYLDGASVSSYFDLITGTSTGGIIALGLGSGLTASQLNHLYVERGGEIFPPPGVMGKRARVVSRFFKHRYDREALLAILSESLGHRTLAESRARLCIPSCDGKHGDLYVFKTPHHPDYRLDGREEMVKVAAATSAAPTYYKPLDSGGFTFLDGGVWANNPIMVGLAEALSAFSVPRERIRILSIGTGDAPYVVSRWQKRFGGLFHWRSIMSAAIRFQSLSVVGQAGLVIGRERITRVEPRLSGPPIELDDWRRAKVELPSAAEAALGDWGESAASDLLKCPAAPYSPTVHQLESNGVSTSFHASALTKYSGIASEV